MARNSVQFLKGISLNDYPLPLRNRRTMFSTPYTVSACQKMDIVCPNCGKE